MLSNPVTNTGRGQTQEKGEKETDVKNIEKITVKLKEILRYQKRTYDLRSVWQGFVRVGDVLDTPPMKELKAQRKDIENASNKDPKTFGEEIWKDDKYIRLRWSGNLEEPQKRYEGKRERSQERRKGEKGGEGKARRAPHK